MGNKSYFILFLVSFIYIAFYLHLNWPYLNSNFLIYDDTIFIPKAYFNLASYPHSPILYFLVDVFSKYELIDSLKIIILLINTINIILISIILSQYIRSAVIAIVLGFAIGSIPIAADQIIFVTGSHPTLSVLFILLSLFIFDRIQSLKGIVFVFSNIGILIILFCAVLSSPSALLAPFALPIWLVMAWSVFRNSERAHWWWITSFLVSAVLVLVIYMIMGIGKYHYTGIVGWTDFSLSTIFQNSIEGATRTASIYGDIRSRVFILFTICMAIVFSASLHQWWVDRKQPEKNSNRLLPKSNNSLVLGVNALVASALTFGPASVVTNMIDRYLVAPVILGLLSIVAIILYIFIRPLTGWRRVVICGALILVVGINLVRTKNLIDKYFSGHLHTHNAVSNLVTHEARKWPDNAQIVLLLTRPGYTSPTVGFNHWSTWYLRYMTRNPNILGLLGEVSSVQRDPFVMQYRDHGQEYWEVIGGRSRRIKMIGLEPGRSLFGYKQDQMDKFIPIDCIVFTNDLGLNYVPFGGLYQKNNGSNHFKNLCNQKQMPLVFMWPGIIEHLEVPHS